MLLNRKLFSTNAVFISTNLLLLFIAASIGIQYKTAVVKTENEKEFYEPADNFYFSRTYPNEIFPLTAYKKAMEHAQMDYENKLAESRGGGDSWIVEGPANISGRMNTIAIDPFDNNNLLVGLASGGIFKSNDHGETWYPVFDDFSYLAIAHIVYDPVDENVIYAGTGDPNISGYPFIGDGIYKSTDGGETWSYSGLSETFIVSKIIVHPADNNIIYAATMGLPFERNIDRGLYKSEDAGATWNKILFVDDDAGIIDIVSDPDNADIIYAASWNRIRNNHESLVWGDNAHIYKSTDGGDSWNILSDDLPIDPMSRISLEMHPDDANIIYACFVGADLGLYGIYKTIDGGLSWNEINTGDVDGAFSGFGWYFDGIQINTKNPDDLFLLAVQLYRTSNDGDDWETIDDPLLHADKHAMAFQGDETYYLATDGGLYRTSSDADHWTDTEDIPSTQLYHVDLNVHSPGIYYGGFQDNGTNAGNSFMIESWYGLFGADGFHTEFRSDDDDIFYVETQNGGIVVFDGFSYYDATNGIDWDDRTNWNTPYIISKHDPDILYAGTYRIYKSDDGVYPYYNAISDDLSDGIIYEERFHTVSVIEESDFDALVLFAGTTDANVQRTTNGGITWENITGILPEHYVTDIAVSHTNEDVVFVSNSGYRENDFVPHIFKSNDLGSSWINISGDLPDLAVNAIVIHPGNDNYIFVATDGGAYYTLDGGADWERLGDNMPVIAVYDLEYDAVNNKIIAGTHARGCWSISLSEIILLDISVSDDITICTGEEAVLTASGAETYTWSPLAGIECDPPCAVVTVTPTETTTYTVTGTDAFGNIATDEVTVFVNPKPEIEITLSVSGGPWLIAEPEGDYTYQWYLDDEIIGGETNDSLLIAMDVSGIYEVIVTNQFGCEDTVIYEFEVGIEDNDDISINIYPNPVHQFLFFNISLQLNTKMDVSVFDITGRKIIAQAITNQNNNVINISTLPAGNYFLEIRSGSKKAVQKFMKL
ncbi:MAG: T9SS type A sorting domain-containing protein [Fimbriimonadaceae bacterium]|nr:T9SS type A sorting domain-containing protein [Chitinophagales bacterium]